MRVGWACCLKTMRANPSDAATVLIKEKENDLQKTNCKKKNKDFFFKIEKNTNKKKEKRKLNKYF